MVGLRRFCAMFGLALLIAAVPAGATAPEIPAPQIPAPKTAAEAEQQIGAIRAELQAYGQWLVRLDAAAKPTTEAVAAFQSGWAAASKARTAAAASAILRPVFVGMRRNLAASDTALRALDAPEWPTLQIDPAIQPAQLVREMLEINRHLGTIVTDTEALAATMANGTPAASRKSALRLFGSLEFMLKSRILMATAIATTLEAGSPDQQLMVIERLFAESGHRMVTSAASLVNARPDPTLPADLERLAGEVDAATVRGSSRLEADLAMSEVMFVDGLQNEDARIVVDKAFAVRKVMQRMFGVARSYSASLRASARTLRKTRTEATMLAAMQSFASHRQQLDALARDQMQIMAR